MSPVATEERRMLPLGGGLKRSASFVISVDEVEVFVISFIIRSTFYVNSYFTFQLLLVLFGSVGSLLVLFWYS